MIEWIYYGCDFLYTAVRVWVAFQLVAAVLEPACEKWIESIIIWAVAIGIGLLNVYNNILISGLFSNNMLLVIVILMVSISRLLFRRDKGTFQFVCCTYLLFWVGLVLIDLLILTLLYIGFDFIAMDGSVLFMISQYRAYYLLICSILILMVGKYLCGKLPDYKKKVQNNVRSLWILVPLFTCGMIYFQRLYLLDFSYQLIDRWGTFLLAVISFVSFHSFRIIRMKEEKDVDLLKQRVEMMGSNYQALLHVNREKAHLSHDIQNHMQVLRELAADRQMQEILSYLDQIDGILTRKSHRDWTNHDVLNLVLNTKFQEAQEADISIYTEFDDMKGLLLQTIEICTLFTNLLDNAIEANNRNADSQERWIRLSCERKGELMIISISNPVDEHSIKYAGTILETSKDDKRMHGFGLRSIQQVLDAHEGHKNIVIENDIFCLTACIRGFNR